MKSGKLMSLTKTLYSLHAVVEHWLISKVLTTYSILKRRVALHFFNERSDLSDIPRPRSGQRAGFFFFFCRREPLLPTRRSTKTTSLPPSSFTVQGRLMLATPPQLACSLWCGLSGGEHTGAAPRSPNEMPVSEGACGTVKVKKKKKNSGGVRAPDHGW